jgi:hypothetical protein
MGNKTTLREMGYNACTHPKLEAIAYPGGCNPFNCKCIGHRQPWEREYRCIFCAAQYDDRTKEFRGGSVDARIKWELVQS